jgi:uncharacterized membrane protein/sporulation protein YlmC with PRC-barrel domain
MISSISIGSNVICTNGSAGIISALIVDPATKNLTHIAVGGESLLHGEDRLVAVNLVTKSSRDEVNLSCTKEDVLQMKPFTRTHYLEQTYGEDGYAYSMPYMTTFEGMAMTPDMGYISVQDRLVPQGEVEVHRGMTVEAQDGYLGQVGELLIDQKTGQVTNFLLMKGHLGGKKEIAIPLTMIDHMEEEVVHLNVDQEKINALPSLPVNRTWNEVVATDLELMVWTFSADKDADQALDKINALSNEYKLEVLNAVVLKKDSKGNIQAQEQKKVKSKGKVAVGIALGGLAGMLIGPLALIAGAVAGGALGKKSAHKVEVGFSEDKLRKINEQLPAGGSALFLVVEHRWFNTLQLSLAGAGGQMIHERLADITYDELVEKLSAAGNES